MQPTQVNQSTEVLIAENIKHLRAAQKLLSGIDDDIYSNIETPLFTSNIGAQLRHCLDFYQCFIAGIRSGKINYDLRERDEETENSRFRAIQRIEETAEWLWKLSATDEQIELWVRQDSPYWSVSSLRRELQFLLSHLVHHQALIAIMLRVQGIVPAEELGVAPATLDNWKSKNVFQKMISRQPRLSVVF
jgi:uncharacterized damage-inducible protein DinB